MKSDKRICVNPLIFYSFVLIGISLFICFSLKTKLDVVQTVDIKIENNKIIISGEYESESNKIYVYKDRNEKIYKLDVEKTDHIGGQTVFWVNQTTNLNGSMKADIVNGRETLLKRIFLRAGKG